MCRTSNYFIRSSESNIFNNAEIAVVSVEKSKERRKRVRFPLNDNNDVEGEVVFRRPPMTEDEMDSMWWSHLEYKVMRAEARESCDNGLRTQPRSRYMSEYLQVATSCIGMGPTEEEKARFFQAYDDDRGLEDYYVPFKSSAVCRVLIAQNKMKASIEPDVRDRLLSAASRHLSRSSRLLASIVGEADALAAKMIQ